MEVTGGQGLKFNHAEWRAKGFEKFGIVPQGKIPNGGQECWGRVTGKTLVNPPKMLKGKSALTGKEKRVTEFIG